MSAVRLINLLISLRRIPPLSNLSGDEERMLFELRSLFSTKGSLAVYDVYQLIPAQSPSTSYRQLMALKATGLVEVIASKADRRQKSVSFTKAADDLFRELEK